MRLGKSTTHKSQEVHETDRCTRPLSPHSMWTACWGEETLMCLAAPRLYKGASGLQLWRVITQARGRAFSDAAVHESSTHLKVPLAHQLKCTYLQLGLG